MCSGICLNCEMVDGYEPAVRFEAGIELSTAGSHMALNTDVLAMPFSRPPRAGERAMRPSLLRIIAGGLTHAAFLTASAEGHGLAGYFLSRAAFLSVVSGWLATGAHKSLAGCRSSFNVLPAPKVRVEHEV